MTGLLLGMFLGYVLGIIVHEAGHVAMALLAGFRLRLIAIGTGRILFAGGYRGIDMRLSSLPFGGIVVVLPEMRARKTPTLMFASGGVVANFLLMLGVLALSWLGHLPANLHQAAMGFYFAQALLIFLNLIPQTVSVYGMMWPNDGKQSSRYWSGPTTA